jgi:hypothetical protein
MFYDAAVSNAFLFTDIPAVQRVIVFSAELSEITSMRLGDGDDCAVRPEFSKLAPIVYCGNYVKYNQGRLIVKLDVKKSS